MQLYDECMMAMTRLLLATLQLDNQKITMYCTVNMVHIARRNLLIFPWSLHSHASPARVVKDTDTLGHSMVEELIPYVVLYKITHLDVSPPSGTR
jgi:hypothetical protein